MKNILLLLLLTIVLSVCQAQVAINPNGAPPNSSAMLDIVSPNKGLLIPRVFLKSTIDNTTIPKPSHSLLVYNYNGALTDGAGFYFNRGTAEVPAWQPLQSIPFPYYNATSTEGTAFTAENYSQALTSSAIKGYGGGSGIGVQGVSNTGIGVQARSTNGMALQVLGKMRIAGTGQTPGVGKVLTSDATGNATWQGAVAFSATGVRAGSQNIASATSTRVRFNTQAYDVSGSYNDADAGASHSMFVAPVHGIYHFDVQISWIYSDGSGNDYSSLSIMRRVNGVAKPISYAAKRFDGENILYQTAGIDVELNAGDEIYVTVYQTTGETLALDMGAEYTYFNGHLITRL